MPAKKNTTPTPTAVDLARSDVLAHRGAVQATESRLDESRQVLATLPERVAKGDTEAVAQFGSMTDTVAALELALPGQREALMAAEDVLRDAMTTEAVGRVEAVVADAIDPAHREKLTEALHPIIEQVQAEIEHRNDVIRGVVADAEEAGVPEGQSTFDRFTQSYGAKPSKTLDPDAPQYIAAEVSVIPGSPAKDGYGRSAPGRMGREAGLLVGESYVRPSSDPERDARLAVCAAVGVDVAALEGAIRGKYDVFPGEKIIRDAWAAAPLLIDRKPDTEDAA